MGAFNKKNTNTTNLSETNITETRQTDQSGGSLNFSDIAGGVSLELSESYTTTDQGAIAAGLELGLAGLQASSDAGSRLATSYGQSLGVLERVNANSLDLLAALASGSIDASKTIARDSAKVNADFLSQAIAGFGALAKQTSEGSDDKIARVVGFALAAVAAVVVLPALFKSGGKAVLV